MVFAMVFAVSTIIFHHISVIFPSYFHHFSLSTPRFRRCSKSLPRRRRRRPEIRLGRKRRKRRKRCFRPALFIKTRDVNRKKKDMTNTVLLVKIEGPVWYTIYHQPTNGKRTSMDMIYYHRVYYHVFD